MTLPLEWIESWFEITSTTDKSPGILDVSIRSNRRYQKHHVAHTLHTPLACVLVEQHVSMIPQVAVSSLMLVFLLCTNYESPFSLRLVAIEEMGKCVAFGCSP
jgi:hypothetical protein